jgi:triacylglycerol lipase
MQHTHSSIIAAIAKYPNELIGLVHAFVSMQAPYGGTYLAEIIMGHHVMMELAKKLVQDVFKGDLNCMADLTYESRKKFVDDHPLPTQFVPTVCFASKCESGLMFPISKFMHSKYGVHSDGMVPEDDGKTGVDCEFCIFSQS